MRLRKPLIAMITPMFLAFLVLSLSGFTFSHSNHANSLYTLKGVAHIPNWNSSACYDIVYIANHRAYVADNMNAGVDKIQGTHVTLVGAGLFQGPAGCQKFQFQNEGPTGTLFVHDKLWAGDGNSTVKVFSHGQLAATITTGVASDNRADELDYIPTTNQVVVANPDAPVPFLTYIDASSYKVIAKQVFSDATAGLEQPRFAYGLLFQAVPATKTNPGGEIDVINPVTHTVYPNPYVTPNCGPSGLVIVGILATTGCANGPGEIVNLVTHQVTVVKGSGASDMVAADPQRGRVFFASYADSMLYVANMYTGAIIDSIPTDAGAHSVAVDETTGEVYVPEGSKGGIAEYTLHEDDD